MTRPALLLMLAVCSWAGLAFAQAPDGTPGTPAAPAAPAPAAPASPAPGAPGATPGTPAEAPKPATPQENPLLPPNPFGFDDPAAKKPASPFGQGASSSFGTEKKKDELAIPTGAIPLPTPLPQNPATYSGGGFYGQGRQTFTFGEGRLARPRYRYSVSSSMGFDDNVFQTSADGVDVPDQVFRQVIPAEPEIAVTQNVREQSGVIFNGGAFVPVFRTVQRKVVLRAAQPERVIEQVFPGSVAEQPQSSVVSGIDANFDVQWARARSLLTMDLRLGAEYYWSRDDPLDYNGSFSIYHLRKFGPRIQLTSSLLLSYLTQPDFSQVNLSDAGQRGGQDYMNGNFKTDLNYRWSPRWRTVTSLTANTIYYVAQPQGTNGSYWSAGFGNEFQYVMSPRLTWIAELRYSITRYLDTVINNSNTVFALAGFDWQRGSRIRSTFRVGQALRTFETGGERASTPFGEMNIHYRATRRGNLDLSSRYGFEEASTPGVESLVFRTSLGYTHTFSPKLSGTLSANFLNTTSSSRASSAETTSDILDAALSFNYIFSRRFSVNLRYNFTDSSDSLGVRDYIRNRIFFTGRYEF